MSVEEEDRCVCGAVGVKEVRMEDEVSLMGLWWGFRLSGDITCLMMVYNSYGG